MTLAVSFELPIRLVSEANNTEHWTVKNKRKRLHQDLVKLKWEELEPDVKLPCTVKLTRLGPRELDYGNLVHAFKGVQDEIAACLVPDKVVYYLTKKGKARSNKGHCDGDKRISWLYDQAWHPVYAIRLEVYQEHSPAREEYV